MVTPFADPALVRQLAPPESLVAESLSVTVAGAEYEQVGDVDDRKRVQDTAGVPWRWICSIDVTYPGRDDDRLGRGSGVLVGPRQVLTAAHCVYRKRDGARPESLYVAPGRNGRTDPIGRFKAEAFSVSSAYFTDRVIRGRRFPGPHVTSRFDLALVTLERNVADVVYDRAKDPRPYGHWGHLHEGRFTHWRGLDAAFLAGKPVTVAGYPGDWCGDVRYRKGSCDEQKDLATVLYSGAGVVLPVDPRRPGVLLHTADTHKAQSGSPVWVRFRDGTRYLVGIHTGAGTIDAVTERAIDNHAIHLSPVVVAWVRSLMPGVNVV